MAPSGQSRESARERLLAAADALFYEDGITTTGVDRVVARARVAVASLYNLFGSKDNLVVAYLENRDRRWRVVWDAEVARHDDPVDRILAVFTALQRWDDAVGMRRGCAHSAAAAQLGDARHPAHAAVRAHKHAIVTRLTELADAAGYADPARVAGAVLVAYEGVLACRLLGRPDAVDHGRDLARAALAAAPRAGTGR
jgi:AcrR family transcriptional regulator